MNIRIITLAIVTLLVQNAWAQNTFKAIVKDGKNKEILIGVNAVLNKTTNGASSDENGIITISNIPNGVQHITFSYLGYESETKSFSFPLSSTAPVEIFLEQDEEILEEVNISSTRGTRSIQNIPTTVEASGQYFSDQTMRDGKNLKIISTNITGESAKYMAFIQGDKPLIKMTTNVGNGQKILLIKESYGNAFAPFLLENFSEVYVLDPRQESIQNMNLAQFLKDNGIQNVLFLNYLMAPSNSKYMDSLNAMINR